MVTTLRAIHKKQADELGLFRKSAFFVRSVFKCHRNSVLTYVSCAYIVLMWEPVIFSQNFRFFFIFYTQTNWFFSLEKWDFLTHHNGNLFTTIKVITCSILLQLNQKFPVCVMVTWDWPLLNDVLSFRHDPKACRFLKKMEMWQEDTY